MALLVVDTKTRNHEILEILEILRDFVRSWLSCGGAGSSTTVH